jgi:hypothetical protein
MHQRADTPGRDPGFTATVRAWGLDTVLTAVEPKTEAKELCPASPAAS